MTRKPEFDRTAADDAELSALFDVMKQDRAPEDLEPRLLGALAATTAAAAATTAAKVGLWKKLLLLMSAHGIASSALIGAISGVIVCGVYAVVDAPASRDVAPARPASAVGASAGSAPEAPRGPSSAEAEGDVASPPPATPRARTEAPPPASGRPPAPTSVARSADVGGEPPPDPAPIPAPPLPAVDADAGSADAPHAATDPLLRELYLVRTIAALVDQGRCAEARAAITRYTNEQPRGQLGGEVSVLAARCQGR